MGVDPFAQAGPLVLCPSQRRSQTLPLRSVMPELSVTTTENCAPVVDPAETMLGGVLVIVIVMTVEVVSRVQVAFVPQMMSTTVFEVEPVQPCGPVLSGAPQSLSVTRITEFDAMLICSLKPSDNLSQLSSVFARQPDDGVMLVLVDVGGVASEVPGMLTGA